MTKTRWLQGLKRPMRLVAVGLVATGAYLLFSFGFLKLFGLAAPMASLLGHASAGFVSYFGHRRVTFGLSGAHDGAPLRFIALNAASYGVAFVAPWVATTALDLPDAVAIAITAGMLPLVNVILIAVFVFRAPLLDAQPVTGPKPDAV